MKKRCAIPVTVIKYLGYEVFSLFFFYLLFNVDRYKQFFLVLLIENILIKIDGNHYETIFSRHLLFMSYIKLFNPISKGLVRKQTLDHLAKLTELG